MCVLQAVCNRLGIDAGDRLSLDSKKRKFLVARLPDDLVGLALYCTPYVEPTHFRDIMYLKLNCAAVLIFTCGCLHLC